MLFLEFTVAKTRLDNLQELRKMRPKPYKINVYRSMRWKKMSTEELLPGDICSITRMAGTETIPADVLLLSGTCIVNEAMLTGEATPQMKEAINPSSDVQIKDTAQPRLHVLFGGTKVVQATAPPKDSDCVSSPDGGCIGYVLRTGFATEQGNLMRTIISNTQIVTANTMESALFILFLLIFAILSASYVWQKGIESGKRKIHKLVVECLLIVASVVPPELPIQLSLAVNSTLLELRKIMITCTEPFRIPFAGQLDVCCFDKTGTLTSDNFNVDGIAGLTMDTTEMIPVKKLTESHPDTARVLAACHSLVCLEGKSELVGDPLEKVALKALRWSFATPEILRPFKTKGAGQSVRIVTRFHFSSNLKRMSTVTMVEVVGRPPLFQVVCKGAPEIIRRILREVPKDFDEVNNHFAQKGARVLALAYKTLTCSTMAEASNITRDSAEQGLDFAGFLVVSSPAKADSAPAIKMLQDSGHYVVMITGDNPLTACHVSESMGLTSKPCVMLQKGKENSEWKWTTLTGDMVAPFTADKKAYREIYSKYDLCLTGNGLTHIMGLNNLHDILPFVKVFARGTPDQKAIIVGGYQDLGMGTLMCGDGTNDVGALKRAQVGLALMSNGPERREKRKSEKRPRTREELLKELKENEITVPKLGDASIAAPFTSKMSSIMSTCDVVRQGRCALVTTNQMLKILALNCLINAYSMSVLYLEGIKNSDTQKTLVSLVVAAAMLLVSFSRPLSDLAPERPRQAIISLYMLCNIMGQFTVHLIAMSYAVALSKEISPLPEFDPDEENSTEFSVNLVNSAVYLLSVSMQASTIFTNFHGEPFMHGLSSNKGLTRCLGLLAVLTVLSTSEIWPDLNEFLELAPMDSDFRIQLIAIMSADFFGAWIVDSCCEALFPLQKGARVEALRS
eukprot:m.141659 g.141659  ORF g.141659 m.141659 type:complete len:908 (+) comp14857_c0_seq2:731-3454(+)